MKDKVIEWVEVLASKLSVTTEQLWEVLVAQGPVEAAGMLAGLLFGCIAVTVSWKLLIKNWRKIDGGNEPGAVFWAMFNGAGTLAVIVATACLLPGIITGFFNPEYWALNRILTVGQ